MPTQKQYNKINKLAVFEDDKELKKFLEQNFTESLQQLIKLTVKTMVKHEMSQLRQELDQTLQFNGSYFRNMISSFGKITDIPVPRFRQGVPDKVGLNTLNIFESEQHKFAKLIEQMHLLGISQRKIKHLAQVCFGVPISTNRVGAIYKELAEQEAVNLNLQPLGDDFDYLLLDGIWEKTKGYGWESSKSVLLCALGIKSNGERQVIGFSLARQEDQHSWLDLLHSLKRRGLKGTKLKLAILDDNQGLKNALALAYPQVLVQTCIVHKMRNVFSKTGYKNKVAVMEEVKTIFQVQTKAHGVERAKAIVKKWYMVEPKAMAALRFNLETCFTYLAFPKDSWSKLRTTNILEREFREVRRRLKGFDSTFQNNESANRYANSIFNYLNNNYPLKSSLHTNT